MPTQLNPSTTIVTDRGSTLLVDSFVSSGGQGEVYRVVNKEDNQRYALKLYHKSKATGEAVKRIKRLVDLKLDRLDAGICAPFDGVTHGELVGHVARFADGETLLEALESGQLTYPEVFELARRVSSMMEKLSSAGIIHGDIQTQNFKVQRDGAGLQVTSIDLDNFSAPGTPRPNMVGMTLYMAPELRERFLAGKRVHPTELSDRYALGVLLHEVLLHFHPIAGLDGTVEEINAAMLAGWAYDPIQADKPVNSHGYPVASLDRDMIELLRRSLSGDPHRRPKPSEWSRALKQASQKLAKCPDCNVPFVTYVSRTECPFGHLMNVSVLRLENGTEIELDGFATILGRKELGGSKHISRQHLVVRKIGASLSIEPIGMNPTCIREGTVWRTLNPSEITELKPNGRLLVANTPLQYTPK